MREGPPDKVLAGAARWAVQMSGWHGIDSTAPAIPVTTATLSCDTRQHVQHRLQFTVPEFALGRSWNPEGDDGHPLAENGQQVDVAVVVSSTQRRRREYRTHIGRFGVQDGEYDDSDGTVTVEALDVLQRAQEDRLPAPTAPAPGATFATEFRRLMPGGVPVSIHPDLPDRACPEGFTWEDDRLAALYDLATAWPARIRVGPTGVRVLPPLPAEADPEVTLADGQGGVLVAAPRSWGRDGRPNAMVFTGAAMDNAERTPVRAEAVIERGPRSVHGRYGVVRERQASPLITTDLQAFDAATTALANAQRTRQVIRCAIPPDPRINEDTRVRIIRGRLDVLGWVLAYDLPLTVGGGPMTVDVGVDP